MLVIKKLWLTNKTRNRKYLNRAVKMSREAVFNQQRCERYNSEKKFTFLRKNNHCQGHSNYIPSIHLPFHCEASQREESIDSHSPFYNNPPKWNRIYQGCLSSDIIHTRTRKAQSFVHKRKNLPSHNPRF